MKSKFLAVVRNYSNRVSSVSCALNVACMGEMGNSYATWAAESEGKGNV